MKIIVTLEIDGLENWSTNWHDKDDVVQTLNTVNNDIEDVIISSGLIDNENIIVSSKYIE